MSSQFKIRIDGDDLIFAAAHFLTFGSAECERLHGHTYRVRVEISGPLDDNHLVLDFVEVRRELREILTTLDHRVLLPTKNPALDLSSKNSEIEVRLGKRRWIFPADDCLLLDLPNTTTELLAEYIGQQLLTKVQRRATTPAIVLQVELAECDGTAAICLVNSEK